MKPEEQPFYIPDEDEPSVFGSCVTARKCGSGSYNEHLWTWPKWRKEKRWRIHHENWRAKNPDAPAWHCPPCFGSDNSTSEGLKLINRLREELQPGWTEYPVFDPAPTMFIGDTRQISLRWVIQTVRETGKSVDEVVLDAEKERDRFGLTLHNQEDWQNYWWKQIMELPGIGYPIWRYKNGYEHVATPYLLLPGPLSETIVIVRVHEKNPNITYKLVTIKQKGGEVVGEFTEYEGFDREQLGKLLNTFWAGF
jgi:hypothetical protein